MFIFSTIKAIFKAGENQERISHLENLVHKILAERAQDSQHLSEMRGMLNEHQRRLLYLEMWKEIQGDCDRRIKELKEVQENQKVRVRNLESKIVDEILPELEILNTIATTESEQKEARQLNNQLKTYLTRAKNLVGLN